MEIKGKELTSVTYDETAEIPQDIYDKILQHVKYEEVKKKVAIEYKKETFDPEKAIDRFLETCKADRTKEIYGHTLKKFMEEGVHFFDVTAEMVDDMVYEMKQKWSPSTVHLKIAALSSFYSYLVRWKYLIENPFVGSSLPKLERVKVLRVPDDQQIDTMINFYKEIRETDEDPVRIRMAEKMIVAIKLMSGLGLRAGALETLQVKGKRYRAVSKGKIVKGDFLLDTSFFLDYNFFLAEEYPFRELKKAAIQQNFYRLKKQLNLDVNAHGFRHYFAVNLFNKTRDVYEVSRQLNHSSIKITEKYLDSLDIDTTIW